MWEGRGWLVDLLAHDMQTRTHTYPSLDGEATSASRQAALAASEDESEGGEQECEVR